MTRPDPPPKGRLLRTIRTVAWGLLGVRGHKLHEQDAPSLSPLQILITALVFMLVFVLTLVTVAISMSKQ
ncbi:MAG: DUF2970 domain-containing protein [Rhodocyclales bacterium]|jgi:hypothetical protein|nr:DUF2970 domain-containing protein [Rhodocyclales bacterium]